MRSTAARAKHTLLNALSRRADLLYIVETADWSIRWDGKQITDALNASRKLRAMTRTTSHGLRNTLLHFGSWGTYIANDRFGKVHSSNRIILTIFHVADQIESSDVRIINERVSLLHTSSEITRRRLIQIGIDSEKIVIVPLGVDCRKFVPVTEAEKTAIRKKLGLPSSRLLIGSFQKDGVGWGNGDEPKLIKGPDIFLETIEQLKDHYSLHVILTGPARGFVKNGLRQIGVPFTHVYLKRYPDIVRYYQSLDVYLVTSRIEGGPKALLEAGACGIPIVTTPVGMAPEFVISGTNGFMTAPEDFHALAMACSHILNNSPLASKLTDAMLATVQQYDWTKIAQKYYEQLYHPLLP